MLGYIADLFMPTSRRTDRMLQDKAKQCMYQAKQNTRRAEQLLHKLDLDHS